MRKPQLPPSRHMLSSSERLDEEMDIGCVTQNAGQSKQSDQQGHQPSIGEFIMQQPESRRSIRLSEVRSLAWAQLQHNCRLEIRVIWKMQPPHQKQVCLCPSLRLRLLSNLPSQHLAAFASPAATRLCQACSGRTGMKHGHMAALHIGEGSVLAIVVAEVRALY